jgi:GATA-binding protein
MKKTVIKRRKRVPAAPGVAGAGAAGRLSDQAAAEALVAVGRAGGVGGNGNGTGTGEESDGEAEQPRKKRAKRGGGKTTRASAVAAAAREDDDMEGESEGREAPNVRERKRPAVNGWGPDAAARSASPSLRASSRNQDYAAHLSRGAPPHSFTGGSPHPFELPPLAALSNGAAAAFLTARPDFGAAAQSSYMRSGSNAPSRTHSPLNPGAAGGYILPPPHVLTGYYPGAPPPPGDLGSLMHLGMAAGAAIGGLGMHPTLADLERHYFELNEHKRGWEAMMERTDKIMAGVKRTIDEMKGLSLSSPPRQPSPLAASSTPNPGQASPSQVGHSLPAAGGASVPLARGRGDSNREDRRDSVWPVTEPASTRD